MAGVCSWTASGLAAGRATSFASTPGSGSLRPAATCAGGFGHEPARWEEFRARYRTELTSPDRERLLDELAGHARAGRVTLVFGARDAEHNQAVVIAEAVRERLCR